jgi:hypothetical protein
MGDFFEDISTIKEIILRTNSRGNPLDSIEMTKWSSKGVALIVMSRFVRCLSGVKL